MKPYEQNRLAMPGQLEVEGDDVRLNALRPRTFSDYIGQEKVKQNLSIYINAAKKRGDSLDHVLFYGPPGLGKTSLANIVAVELNVNIKSTSGPVIEKTGDLAAILTNLQDRDVLFIDEIHRMSRIVEEVLYPAMEDYTLDLLIGQGPSARTMKFNLPRFTLIGATTRAGLLSSPLRDRFGMIFHLDLYDDESLMKIVNRSARILNIQVDQAGALEIARRSRGTPRIVNRLLRRVWDVALVRNENVITKSVTQEALAMMEIDNRGLDLMDRKIIGTIIEKYRGGPVGIDTIAASINEDKRTIEDIYEPYLIQIGFIDKTLRGRLATCHAYEHFGYNMRG